MEYIYKEVNFTKYCPLCEEADTHEEKDPCGTMHMIKKTAVSVISVKE